MTVSRSDKTLVLVASCSLGHPGLSLAQDDASDAADLTAVIALQGKPCGRVVSVMRRGENDFVATCQDGNRYHIFVRDGRVVVEEA
jgi:hypothetical protein